MLGRLLAITAVTTAIAMPAHAIPVLGLTGGSTLLEFDSSAPSTITGRQPITGLAAGEVIRGIDTRPATGQFYALGQSGQLYTVNLGTGAATASGIPVTLSRIDYGFAFNPVPDRARIVSASGQNLRVNPDTGATTVDTPLAYAAGDANFGVTPTVTGAAYTNQNPGIQTTTTLYDIDAATNSLVIQNPPNAGTLTTVGALGVPLFNFGVGPGIGFDIDGATGTALASFVTATGGNGLYSINLGTGAASLIGAFGTDTVSDIAFGTLRASAGATPVPEPASAALLGMGALAVGAFRRRR